MPSDSRGLAAGDFTPGRESRFRPWTRTSVATWRFRLSSTHAELAARRPQRQEDAEAGAFAGAGVHVHAAAVAGDDAVTDGQPQAGALADRLGGEERIEDVGQVLSGDAAAVV